MDLFLYLVSSSISTFQEVINVIFQYMFILFLRADEVYIILKFSISNMTMKYSVYTYFKIGL